MNRRVLRRLLNASSDDDKVTWRNRLFHTRAAATARVLSPLVNISGYSLLYSFSRTMLCISAAYVVMRCLSVRPSRSWILWKRASVFSILRLFSLSGSQIILVILYQTLWRYSDVDPVSESVNFRGGGMKNCDFWPTSRFIILMSHSYYGRWIRNRVRSTWCCQPSMCIFL